MVRDMSNANTIAKYAVKYGKTRSAQDLHGMGLYLAYALLEEIELEETCEEIIQIRAGIQRLNTQLHTETQRLHTILTGEEQAA
jgi:hypothetical protein